ncbi:GrpB family protein [Thalassobacillus pellis]|uniref:GrpB family protein n=1 Tax=Thalassobacillus pellis TaxID=748008 RepID=UPI00195FC251|nr:GrpB family protein [Thalassobacillus pellis]MBM7553576.1 GrpB-like predicted nucleotidyltransferase (UPF0157 family) [Thalassobacillus pellis]
MRKVEVTSYNPEWKRKFEKEAKLLRDIFGVLVADIHHIGSTSVECMKAKPIIDIMPVVYDIKKVDEKNDDMRKIGYQPKGEYGIPGRRYFRKGGDLRTHHVHIFEFGDNNIERHLAFRDYLRTYTQARVDYGNLKTKLAERFPNDMDSYIEGKEKFVVKLEGEALKWYRKQSGRENL